MDSDSTTSDSVQYRNLAFMGYPKYKAGNDGSVWSLKREGWKKLVPRIDRKGYHRVWLCSMGRRDSWFVAAIVLTAFVGTRPAGMQTCHAPDRNPANNALSNLRWDTCLGNQRDRQKHGTHNKGQRNGRVIVTEEMVREIRRLSEDGANRPYLMRRFHLSNGAIGHIIKRRNWQHVE